MPVLLGIAGELVLGPDELEDTVNEAPDPAVEGAPKGSAIATTERQQRMTTTDKTIQQLQVSVLHYKILLLIRLIRPVCCGTTTFSTV